MRVARVELRDFRNVERASVELADGITLVHGPNGAGKTNLLEALYFGLTGRSCRTANERDLVRFGAPAARVEVTVEAAGGTHAFEAAFEPATGKRLRVDGVAVSGPAPLVERPLVSVFLPDRL